jgi:hypothetical protein
MKTFKILPNLDEKNRARLEARQYTKAYTDIPNRALPVTYKDGLSAIYTGLTGGEFPEEGSTFTVRSDANGTFKRLYSPTVFSTEDKGLIIRWGDEDIALSVADGKLTAPNGQKGLKLSFKEEMIGKYTEAVLSVAFSSGGTVFTLPVPIRSADYENRVTSDILDVLLSENPDAIADQIAVASDPSKRGESSGERLQGPFIKVAHMPLGEYKITSYRAKDSEYGMQYYLQAVVNEPFAAPTRQQVDGEWQDVEVEITDFCVVKPNNQLKKVLAADPEITPDKPAFLSVKEHGEWNGFATAKCVLKCSSFVKDDDSFDIDF